MSAVGSTTSKPPNGKQGLRAWLTGTNKHAADGSTADAQVNKPDSKKHSIRSMPRGPYPVGYCDLELVRCMNFNITPDKHLVGRLFYPCVLPEDWRRHPKPMPWLSDLRYVDGYVEFLFWQAKSWRMAILKQVAKAAGYWESNALYINYVQGAAPSAADQGSRDTQGTPGEKQGASEEAQGVQDVPTSSQRFPVVIFSHGIGSCRATYSLMAGELASRGCVVFCVEHCDGTAAGAKLAKDWGWRYFDGQLGDLDMRYSKTKHRVVELRTAVSVMKQLHEGDDAELMLTDGLSASESFKGRLDLSRIVLMGHSYGGASAACLAAEEPSAFSCCVALDPWWPAIPPTHVALQPGHQQPAPLVCISSEDWNTPDETGALTCGASQQDTLLKSFAANGALVSAIKYSQHNACSDILPLFGESLSWILKQIGFQDAHATPLELLLRTANAVLVNLAHTMDWFPVAPVTRNYQEAGMTAEVSTTNKAGKAAEAEAEAASTDSKGDKTVHRSFQEHGGEITGDASMTDAHEALDHGEGVPSPLGVEGAHGHSITGVSEAVEEFLPNPPDIERPTTGAGSPAGAASNVDVSGDASREAANDVHDQSAEVTVGQHDDVSGSKAGNAIGSLPKPVRKALTQDFVEWQRCRFKSYVSHFRYSTLGGSV